MKIVIPSKFTDMFVPDLESINLLEYFLISAVCSLLGIRAFLTITGFPQLGGGGIHIAHMLWGGILMFLSISIFATFINSRSKVVASLVGGVGFGAFIDELGKFITADNNYFFKPTIALIYVIFICIFLIIRWLSSITEYSSKTYLANAMEGLRELIIFDLDSEERARALKYLHKADKDNAITKLLLSVIENAKPEQKRFSLYFKLKQKTFEWYKSTLNVKIISNGLIVFFVLASLTNVVVSVGEIVASEGLSFYKAGSFLTSLAVAAFVLEGLRHYVKKDLLNSYYSLQKATLIAIFIMQLFYFLQNQLLAIITLIVFISVYLILKFAIEAEGRV